MEIIKFERTMNTRDLGGYASLDGRTIRKWRFIRSDGPNHLLANETKLLHEQGITTSIDLRTPRVADKYRSSLRDDSRFQYHLFPIVEGTDVPPGDDNVAELYMSMLSHYETFRNIFKTIAASNGGVIYNCSAGKDRTGMVSFLLLEYARVPREVIANDYAASTLLIEANIERIRQYDNGFPTFLGYSHKEYILRFFDLFDKKYESIAHYFELIGLTDADLKRIEDKLFA